MEREYLEEIVNLMTEKIGCDGVLDELVDAMNSNELEENLRYIDRTNDLHIFECYDD